MKLRISLFTFSARSHPSDESLRALNVNGVHWGGTAQTKSHVSSRHPLLDHVGIRYLVRCRVEPGRLELDALPQTHRLVGGQGHDRVGHRGPAVAARLQVLAVG